jgi:hypothetical protein
VKILLLVSPLSQTRYFAGVIRTLAERGHTLRLAGTTRRGQARRPAELDHPLISALECPRFREDAWRDFVQDLRCARDYTRYLAPRYASATRLRERADQYAPPAFVRVCEGRAWARRNWKLLARALELAEDLVPSDRAFEAFLEAEGPDIVLVSPLIQFGSYQTDYVKAAHRVGLPVGFLPYSWDNLTGRGLIRVIPDRVLAWNETQKREAVDLHGVPPERVIVTGAPRFDEFFAMRPATTREEFCARAGLDPARPFILYLGSSPLIGPREAELVPHWVDEIRAASDPSLRSCGILVRPHPACRDEWRSVALTDRGAAVWLPRGRQNADQELYDSLHHAAAVVGLCTSALIQAGILGKSVHTIVMPGFDEGQAGTLHFEYLLASNGGLLSPAYDFEEHRRQLAGALASGAARREQSLRFVERFVRPHGLDVPVTPIMVREIERLAEIRKPVAAGPPLWHHPLRRILLGWLRGRARPRGAGATPQPASLADI